VRTVDKIPVTSYCVVYEFPDLMFLSDFIGFRCEVLATRTHYMSFCWTKIRGYVVGIEHRCNFVCPITKLI
jgi:hypothetical protein